MILLCILLILVAIFYDSIFVRNYRRFHYYKMASMQSKKLNKKLIVVGCPWSGGISGKISLFLKLYKCGDLLIDKKEKSNCKNHIQTDLKKFLEKQNDNSMVIFVSVVLEYVDDLNETIVELERVAGRNLFIVPIDIIWERWFKINMGNYNHLKRKNLIIKWPPKFNKIEFKKFKI